MGLYSTVLIFHSKITPTQCISPPTAVTKYISALPVFVTASHCVVAAAVGFHSAVLFFHLKCHWVTLVIKTIKVVGLFRRLQYDIIIRMKFFGYKVILYSKEISGHPVAVLGE